MYMKMRGIIYIVILILLSSCGNFLDEYSQDLVVPKTVSDLNEVLLGNGYIPSSEIEYLRSGSIGWQLNILDDDINTVIAYNAVKGRTEMDQVYYGYTTWQMEVGRNYTGDNLSGDNGNWDALYQRINSMNIILHELGNVSQNTEQEVKDAIRVQGECYFLRAQFYLMLVNLYAKAYDPDNAATEPGVPLKLTYYVEHDKEKETQFDRTSVAKVYEQIVKDLKEAVRCFTESPQTKSFYRASEDAALLLLSRVYLYMGEWQLVIDECDEIIKMGCSLWDLNNFDPGTATFGCKRDYFLAKESPEIFFTQGAGVVGLLMDNQNITSQTRYRASDELYGIYSKYEKDGILDLRKNCFFEMSKRDNGYFFVRKNPMFDATVFDSFLLRSGEIYLNKAEAQAMLDQADAINTMKELMNKRYADHKLPVIDGLSGKELIQFIREERRKELCFEGHRWFDLRRYAVSPKYPETKAITHVIFKPGTSLMDKAPYDRSYVLQPYGEDNAWVLPIPEEELVFNNGVMVDNPERIERE